MPSNLIARLGLDASGFFVGLGKLPKATESVSKKIAKSLSFTDLSKAVSESLGEIDLDKKISEVNSENIDEAIAQLDALTEYKKRLRSMGFTDKLKDDRYESVSRRIKELNFDIRQYEIELQQQASAQMEAANSSKTLSDVFQSLLQKMRAMKDAASDQQPSAQTMEEALERVKSSASGVKDAIGDVVDFNPTTRIADWILSVVPSINDYAAKVRSVLDSIADFDPNPMIARGISRMERAIKRLPINILSHTANGLDRVSSAIRSIPDIPGKIASGVKNIGSKAKEAASIGISKLSVAIRSMPSVPRMILSGIKSIGLLAGKTAVSGVKGLGSALKNVGKWVSNIGNRAKASHGNIGQMVNSLRRVALVSVAFRLAGAAMGRLRSIVSQYISENAALQAQVNGLKSAMGQALAPAINLVVNAMSALLPYVVGVSNAIGQLMAALFGDGWTASANGAKKAAAATGSAAKAQKELNRQLLSFDEINKLSDNSSSGGGGGGSSVDTNITPISGKMPAWMERFKTSFSELFNSDEFKASNIGGKIGMALQTGLDWLGNEGKAFDWRGVGTKLRENFDSFFSAGWWESLWKTSGIFAGGIADSLTGFFQPEWEELKRVYNENGTAAAAAFLAGMTVGLVVDVGDAILSGLGSFGEGLSEYYAEQGNESASGYWKGFSDRAQELREYFRFLWDTIVGWAKEKLGIHSPSTVFAEIGFHCMTGLGNGFSDGISGVLDKLRDLKDRVLSIADRLKDAFSFEWKMPRLRLPHLIVNWDPVDNVLANFFGVTAFPRLSVSWFAKGGILNGAQIFGRMGSTLLGGGEAGKEAVLPLESNTGWMDKIAERVVARLAGQSGGDINATIYLTLDGEVLNRVVIKGLRKYARANGGLPI